MNRFEDRRARFEALYEEHVVAVSRYCLRRSPPGIAEDVAAETFLVAWPKRLRVIGETTIHGKPTYILADTPANRALTRMPKHPGERGG